MAMTILNNSATALSLGELNKNINKLGKALAKVSTGQRITGASDDSASFAISEKMREQIRSLEQDIQNVQNGSSMLKTAHGGIENIVDELRSLKELAINAANDSNTDADRAIMQKEFDSRRATIDEIATWTNYNGKPLLDGTYSRPNSEMLDDVLSYIYNTYKYEYDDNGKVSNVTVTTGVGGTIDDRGIYTDGITGMFSLEKITANGKTARNVDWVNGREVYGDPTDNHYKKTGGYRAYNWVNMDFSNVSRRDGGELNIPHDLHKQGFSAFCSDYDWCQTFHGFMFDANMPAGSGEKVYNTSGPVYIVGIGGIDSNTENWGSEINEALFNGVLNAISNYPNSPESYSYNEDTGEEIIHLSGYGDELELRRTETDGTTTYTMSQHYDMWIYEGYDTGAVYTEPLPPSESGSVIVEEEESTAGVSITDPSYISMIEEKANRFNPLTIHHGTKSNERTNFFINDMHTHSLKGKNIDMEDVNAIQNLSGDRNKQEALIGVYMEAKYKTLDQASVRTQRDANVAIRIVDGALDYALNEATYMGAYLQRLEYTEANVTTQDENVQAAESTIRDADMAKEMTEYTKQNVLSQAAQSMLAQANQNFSSVLGLLQ